MVNPFKGVGRNDPCPCGSGKKFKKCCLDAQSLNEPSAGAHQVDPQAREAAQAEGTIRVYDPFTAPDPEQWLALGEQERIDLVLEYHRHARIRLPRAKLHAVVHVIIENQIADPELPVRRAAQRLMSEGLDRHEAVHAIGSVLAGYLNDLMRGIESGDDSIETTTDRNPIKHYYIELEALTAEEWLRSG